MGEVFWGTVVEVTDGDTLKIDVSDVGENNEYPYYDIERVRLYDVDARELTEPGGEAARARLAKRFSGRYVRVEVLCRDEFKRVLGTVIRDRVR